AQLFDRLGQMCKVIDAEGGRGAVIHIDIDRFRLVNASAGPQIGDALLQAAAEALAATLGSGDTLARSGSDEFVAVLADIATEREAAARAEGFARALAKPMRIEGHDYRLTVSQGIALTPDDGRDAATLLRVAGIAVAQAKATGGNAYRFHDSRAEATAKSRLDLEEGLRAALDRGGFELHYQPKLHLDGGGVVGVEALIRWRRGGALVSPAEFIPIAEETGLIVPIGAWVLREACLQGALWAKDGLGRIPIAVNVSARQLREEGFFATVREAVAASGFSPRLIEIEVTESLIMENPDEAREVLGRLRGLGLRVSIDDFGTGYSSLAVMGRLPVDTVKIDRSFVANLDRGEGAAAIVRTVVALADNLALDVVAEGVETEAQAAALKACGCPVAQGYLFARPMPPAAATAWLRQKLTRQDAEGA
ncbi:MAG: bifunctional diguanylate cyclase/phosphodiesterase, partial [Alphaproteobacteria bacterium]|nr:bifunctional diguanylate cyclase/phosphodiesterase [Alphaproteobacteria bacterium]